MLGALGACTPLRPLDDDAGRPPTDASGPDALGLDASGVDAPGLDAYAPPVPDAPVPGTDAWAPDAPAPPDAWSPDAFVVPEGLIAWYPFDGARDATGRGHDLTITGATLAGTVLQVGSGDRVSTPYQPDLDGIRAISLWVQTAAPPALLDNRAGLLDHDAMFGLFHMSTGMVSCNLGGGMTRLSSSAPLPLGRWVHVVCAHDGTTVRLYFSGELMGSLAAPLPAPSTGAVQIGQNCCDGRDELEGSLADVRIWSRAPTASELAAMVATPPP